MKFSSKPLLGLLIIAVSIVGLAGPAFAQDEEVGEAIVTTLQFDDGEGNRHLKSASSW